MLLALLLTALAGLLNPPLPRLEAAPVLHPVRIDGFLDEVDWQQASPARDFRQAEPTEGATPSQRTEVRVLYGDNALYVGARMFDTQPSSIQRTLGRRDAFNQADWFTVSLDGYHDRKTALFFGVNAAGVQVDGAVSGTSDDLSWDAVWESAVRVDSAGWTAELRIPYSMLRFSPADVQTWGVNFERRIPRTAEVAEWALVRREDRERGLVAGYGTLTGLRGLRPRRNIQVTPYLLASGHMDENHPTLGSATYDANVGADVKIGLASNATLNLTVNPDFGQVESNPAVLNLSAFETVFSERRPFFVEGLDLFDVDAADGKMLYTRRIGASTPIIGAAKLTGRTTGGLAYGLLGAATGNRFDPSTLYSALRARQALGRHSRFGALATYYDGTLNRDAGRRTLVAGTDWDLRFSGNTHAVTGYTSLSHTQPLHVASQTGFSSRIGVARLSGLWRWSLSTYLTDARYHLNDIGRIRRTNLYSVNGSVVHEINGGRPFGRIQQAQSRLSFGNSFSYRENLNQGLGVFFSLDLLTRGYQEVEFDLRTDYLFGGYDLYETRGRGPWAQQRKFSAGVSVETDSRRSWSLEPGFEVDFNRGGRQIEAEIGGEVRVSNRFQLGGSVSAEQEDGVTAWVANETLRFADNTWQIGARSVAPPALTDADYVAFDDGGLLLPLLSGVVPYDAQGRYFVPVFGQRDGRIFETAVRGTATFSPDLSLQVFAQLLAARDRYQRFGLLTSPDAMPLFEAYPKKREYQLTSFQLNAVLRWQYRPGSTLYVVWTQVRAAEHEGDLFGRSASLYDISTRQQLTDAFGLFPANVFLVKLNYLLLR